MSDMHIRTTRGSSTEIVCHFPIANIDNAVGVNYRDAYHRAQWPFSVLGQLTYVSVLPDGDGSGGTIDATEKQSINSETPIIAEVMLRFDYPSNWAGLSGAQQNAVLDSWYDAALTDFQASQQDRLHYYGHTR